MIEEQLISFQVAKLAKEKGCTLNTPKAYNDNGVLVIQSNYPSYIDELDISAPTQSLLQKWLREVHNVSIKIDDYYTNSRVRFDYNVCQLGSQEDNPVGIFETYEEALEIGLYQALVLL